MFWATAIKNKNEIVENVLKRRHCESMLDALQQDMRVDSYQDTQPGGGNCLSDNWKKQKEYENQLCSLYDLKLLFPKISNKDAKIIKYLIQKIEDLNMGPGCCDYSELADEVEQAFLYFKFFPSYQVNNKSIDKFCEIRKYIVLNTVEYDFENELFKRVMLEKPIIINENIDHKLLLNILKNI